MKKLATLLVVLASAALAMQAKTLNVVAGSVTYSVPESQQSTFNFVDGNTVSIGGRDFITSAISRIYVGEEDSLIDDNTVAVTYSATGAEVLVAGNVTAFVDATVNGAHVVINQADPADEITYILQGESTDGSFTLNGTYKTSVTLNGLTLTNPAGAAIDIQCGKRIALRVAEGTENSVTDGANGNHKAALYCKGHLEIKQKGTLNVTGRTNHAIFAKEYLELKNATVNVLGAVKDGINCNQYFLMESGTISISSVGDDGIQVSYKDETDREDVDTGNCTIAGGALNINTSAAAAKAIKVDGIFTMTDGQLYTNCTGGALYDSTDKKTKASAGISTNSDCVISGGAMRLNATGGGGKGISVDGNLHIIAGDIAICTQGGMAVYSSSSVNQNYSGNADNVSSALKSSPKGIKCDGTIVIDGGTIDVQTKGNGGEGIESKKTLTINNGDITIRAYEDGTNSSSHTYINGGNLTVTTGTGDAVDANGAIYVTGGYIRVIGASSPEQGFDAGDGYTISFSGGIILAGGGGNSVPSSSSQGSTQAFVQCSLTLTAGQTVTVKQGDIELCSFVVPASYSTSSISPVRFGPGGGGNRPGGNTGGAGTTVLSCPEMVSGTSYTITCGTTSATATAALTGTSTGPGGPGGW